MVSRITIATVFTGSRYQTEIQVRYAHGGHVIHCIKIVPQQSCTYSQDLLPYIISGPFIKK
jgi:hypothetical protein